MHFANTPTTMVFVFVSPASVPSSPDMVFGPYFGNSILWHLYISNVLRQIVPEMKQIYTTATVILEFSMFSQRPIISRCLYTLYFGNVILWHFVYFEFGITDFARNAFRIHHSNNSPRVSFFSQRPIISKHSAWSISRQQTFVYFEVVMTDLARNAFYPTPQLQFSSSCFFSASATPSPDILCGT